MDVGTHCTHPSCNRLDFLPIKCSACTKTFCSNHYEYTTHNCPNSHIFTQKNIQIPVCPICSQNVPFLNGNRDPNEAISAHIDSGCQKIVKKKKINPNKCNIKGCKKKELIPIICRECSLNFCLTHKFGPDHDCVGKEEAMRRKRMEKFKEGVGMGGSKKSGNSGNALNDRKTQNSSGSTNRAQEELDLQLAVQMQAEWDQNMAAYREHHSQTSRNNNRTSNDANSKDKCSIS